MSGDGIKNKVNIFDNTSQKQDQASIPASQLIQSTLQILDTGSFTEKLHNQNRLNGISGDKSIETIKNKDCFIIDNINNQSKNISYNKLGVALIDGYKKAPKLLTVILQEANKQVLHNGEMTNPDAVITIPIKRLIELGLYKTPQSAHKGYEKAKLIFKTIWYKQRGDYEEEVPVFTSLGQDRKGQIKIKLNGSIKWKEIFSTYVSMSYEAFKLSDNGFTLYHYFTYLNRVKAGKKDKNNYKLLLDTVRTKLFLPNPNQTKNPYRDIIKPIIEALNDISSLVSVGNLPKTNTSIENFLNTPICIMPKEQIEMAKKTKRLSKI